MDITYEGYDLDDGSGGTFAFSLTGGSGVGVFRLEQSSDTAAAVYCDTDDMNQLVGIYELEITVRESGCFPNWWVKT